MVLLKIIQRFKSKSSYTTERVLLRIFADLWIHRENGVRAITKNEVLGRSYIEILQNSTVVGRSLSGQSGNRLAVPKGGFGLSPKDRKQVARRSEGTRLNSSHITISYAVFCLKKKNQTQIKTKKKKQQPNTLTNPQLYITSSQTLLYESK